LTFLVFWSYKTANPESGIAKELMKFKFSAVYSKITEEERFFENTAVNRGFAVRVFDNFEQALEWLEQDEVSCS
jgi:hypothetical protein